MIAPERNITDPQSWNRYVYVRNNPIRYVDPDGRFWETLWDVGNLAYSAYECIRGEGCVGPGVDALATVIPFVPGGMSRLRKADDLVDLVSPKRRKHILDGDKSGGGHRAGTGKPGKSEFQGRGVMMKSYITFLM